MRAHGGKKRLMMTELYVVGLDGSEAAGRALDLAARQARAMDASLVLVHVIEWSRYAIMTPEDLAIRHQMREAEIAQAHKTIIMPAIKRLEKPGLPPLAHEDIIHHGAVAPVLCEVITQKAATQAFIGRTGHSKLAALMFGSTANALAQACPTPITLVP